MNFEFFPKVGLGTITFGMPREQVRVLLNADFFEFQKSIFSKNTTDAYDNLGLHIGYDENNLCDEIEVFEPAHVIFGEEKLVEVDFYEIVISLIMQYYRKQPKNIHFLYPINGIVLAYA